MLKFTTMGAPEGGLISAESFIFPLHTVAYHLCQKRKYKRFSLASRRLTFDIMFWQN